MNTNGITLRWITDACYEIALPNGKVIVIDPDTYHAKLKGFTIEDFTGADYILCTHTHYDHISDIGELAEKYNSKIFTGIMGAPELSKYFDISYNAIYPVSPGESFECEDFTLEVFRAKHKEFAPERNLRYSTYCPRSISTMGGEKAVELGHIGILESLDFLITTQNYLRLMVVSGALTYKNIYSTIKDKAPDIVIRQCSIGQKPEEFADIVANLGCQLVLPHHHQKIINSGKMEGFARKVNEILAIKAPYTKFFNPQPFKWYTISLNIRED